MERGQLRGSTRGVERWRKTQRQGVIWGECNLPPSLIKSFAGWWRVVGVLARAPLLCVQALQEQRTDIRPKNTPHSASAAHSGNHESITLFLQPSPTLGLHAVGSMFGKVHARVCVWCSLTSCFSTTSHATCSPSNPLKGTSRVSISQRTWTQETHQNRLLLPSCLRKNDSKTFRLLIGDI